MSSLRKRVIPVLLLKDESLVKTINFKRFKYIGDPCNTVRIFNELEVDELLFLDITASKESKRLNLNVLKDIANECFMPLGYGGGIKSVDDAKAIFDIGFEKVIINSAACLDPKIITEISSIYGSQAVVVSVDVRKTFLWDKYMVYSMSGTKRFKKSPENWVRDVENYGAGEILITYINNEGTWKGFDVDLIRSISSATNLPVIAHGGAGSVKDIKNVFTKTSASAVGLGSMVVYQKKGMGVLVNYPNKDVLEEITL